MDSRTLDTNKTTTSPTVSSGTGDRIILDRQTLCGYELIKDERPFFDEIKYVQHFSHSYWNCVFLFYAY